ncbi:uncharacterized protein LOC106465604 [Limulus polyphemus]|uniref:Uncharacterized protein LOC106465604 n=1 Tax=Limulus polyphemus TaxID=6850 RepID=A0ABM1BG19_LIMPO|nr:uncharacterized protein LOC106465604 [Limulus polyphemus]
MSSHKVVVTRRTTTNKRPLSFALHTDYVKSTPGILKAVETVLGTVSFGLLAHYCQPSNPLARKWLVAEPEEVFFFMTTFVCVVITFLLLLSCIVSFPTASFIPKTLFELLYHCLAFIFYLCGSLSVLILVAGHNETAYWSSNYGFEGKITAAVIGLVNTALYFFSAFFSFRSFNRN